MAEDEAATTVEKPQDDAPGTLLEPAKKPDETASIPPQSEVTVTFHAGGTQITMADLAILAPGSVLPTHAPADTSVEIRANGKRIGQGEMMQLDGGRVVRVTSLAT